jgi:hypothetical protein
VSDWGTLFLGIIAAATLVMAVLQVGAVVFALRIAKRVERLADELHGEVRPLIASAQAVAQDAQRAARLAAAQAERVDALISDLSRRVDQTAGVLQDALIRPAREGLAIVAGLKAGLELLRGGRGHASSPSQRIEEEDALFIG